MKTKALLACLTGYLLGLVFLWTAVYATVQMKLLLSVVVTVVCLPIPLMIIWQEKHDSKT